jgi:hypothetical protein
VLTNRWSTPSRLLFLALMAAMLTIALSACGGGKEEGGGVTSPSASASPEETADPVEDFPELTPFSAELQAKLHEIRAKVSEIRGIPVHPTAEEGLVSKEALAEYGRDQFASLEEEDAADIEAGEQMLTLMGLIPPGYTFETYVEEEVNVISGVYYFEANRLVLVGENPGALSISEELTIAHEYAHSLQDAKYELETFFEKWTDSEQQKDGYTSYDETLRCLIEGDAEVTQRLYAEEVYGENWRELQAEEGADDEPLEFDIPDFLLRSFIFYYSDCVAFVEALYEEGGWAAVNAAYDNPPGTTEQILDIAKYKLREWADEPKPQSIDSQLEGWSEMDGGQWGQYDTINYITSRTDDYFSAILSSLGWRSGWIRWFRNDSEHSRIAIELTLAWDTESEASSFEETFDAVLESHGVSAGDVSTDGEVRRWVTSDEFNQHGALVAADDDSSVRLIFATDEEALDTLLSTN